MGTSNFEEIPLISRYSSLLVAKKNTHKQVCVCVCVTHPIFFQSLGGLIQELILHTTGSMAGPPLFSSCSLLPPSPCTGQLCPPWIWLGELPCSFYEPGRFSSSSLDSHLSLILLYSLSHHAISHSHCSAPSSSATHPCPSLTPRGSHSDLPFMMMWHRCGSPSFHLFLPFYTFCDRHWARNSCAGKKKTLFSLPETFRTRPWVVVSLCFDQIVWSFISK